MPSPKLFPLALVCAALLTVPDLRAQTAPPETAAEAPVEQDYEAFFEWVNARPPQEVKPKTEAYYRWLDARATKLTALGLAFAEKYPDEPRRWEVLATVILKMPLFIGSVGTEVTTKGIDAVVTDEPAKAAWERRMAPVREKILTAVEVPVEAREIAAWGAFSLDFRVAAAKARSGQTVDWAAFRARFDHHAASYAGLEILPTRAADYLQGMEQASPGAAVVEWKHLAESADVGLRGAALLKLASMGAGQLSLAFTAVDGRAVDLATLRGKVVLIDFWATWCGPCVAELPNVKQVYAAYHDKGFEVIGISLENANLTTKDTVEQTAAKLAKAKKVLTDFTAKNEMPWPQYFDGKYWKNEISTPYGIQGIPAMFLLDQDGKIVSTNARGEALEATVKKLLKL